MILSTLVLKPWRKEGNAVKEPLLLWGLMVLRRLGSTKSRQWLPEEVLLKQLIMQDGEARLTTEHKL